MRPIVIIAELGSSPAPEWNFDLWCALAKDSGATHVKVQLFRAEHFPAAEQPAKRPLEFPRERLAEFVQAAHGYGLKAGASVFDADAVQRVMEACDFIKLAAREQDNNDLMKLVYLARYRPSLLPIPIYRSIDSLGKIMNGPGMTTLITIPKYPAPLARSSMVVLSFAWRMQRLGLQWGYSSHTTSDLDVRLAVRLGASVIEKHFCLSPTDLEGGHSLTPVRFREMVKRIMA